MNVQYMQELIHVIQNSPLLEGCLGGTTGAFLTVAAHYFVDNGKLNLSGWGRKLLYIIGGGVVGTLLNYHNRIGIMYTTMIGGGWPVLVETFRTAAKGFVESFIRHRQKSLPGSKEQQEHRDDELSKLS